MKMPGARSTRLPETSSQNERGFTFIEILVSLLLLSLLGLVIWNGLSRGEGLVLRTFQAAADSVKILQLDTGLRDAAGRVRVPYWEGDCAATSTDDGISVPWLDGYEKRFLYIERRGPRLAIRFSQEDSGVVFGPFDEISFGLVESPEGTAWGIRVTVAGGSTGDPITLVARFGGEPLRLRSGE
jgi:prepilin-type N-terminal cleavage/methylation domain-containing protein